MWSTILTAGGWALFSLVILLWVGWVSLVQAFFAGQHLEAWHPNVLSSDCPTERPGRGLPAPSPYAVPAGRLT